MGEGYMREGSLEELLDAPKVDPNDVIQSMSHLK